MVKGDDALAKKRNKAMRKKTQRKEGSSPAAVSAHVASMKRRLSGVRRKCQVRRLLFSNFLYLGSHDFENWELGRALVSLNSCSWVCGDLLVFKRGMCFEGLLTLFPELGTWEDSIFNRGFWVCASASQLPLNYTLGKASVKERDTKEAASLVGNPQRQIGSGLNLGKKETEARVNAEDERKQALRKTENFDCPSKFLTQCLSAIEESLRDQGVYYNNKDDGPLFADAWGVEFLNCYVSGKDVLETSGVPSTSEQIAWMVSVAADTISRKEEKGLSVANPFLLYLVPFREKATEVRNVCKPLKKLGIHSVSLHSGASLDHQIQGLKSCEPEFLVSTPERLVELISQQAIDVSGVSFLVIDGIESLFEEGYLDTLNSIRQSISGNPFSVVFYDFLSSERPSALRNLLLGSVCRLSIDHSIRSQGACIVQTVDVCSSELEKFSKGIQASSNACTDSLPSRPLKVLYVVGKDSKYGNIVKILKANGYSISSAANSDIVDVTSQNPRSKLRHVISVMNEDNISSADLGDYEIVGLPNFVQSVDDYVKILTRMARHSLNGVLHSVLSEEHAPLAESLVRTLAQCFQAVPDSLIKLCQRSVIHC